MPGKKSTAKPPTKEDEAYIALHAWFVTPRLQSELLMKEREAVQMVLDVLDRRRREQRREK
jgi:hypothetical protein